MDQTSESRYDPLSIIHASTMSVEEGMEYLLSYCKPTMPYHDYAALRALPYADDIHHLRAWLTDVLTTEPPSDDIRAFFFGLYEPYLDDGLPACQFYVSGSARYDPDDRACEWAVWEEDSYTPQKRYADSPVLTQLYRLVKAPDEETSLLRYETDEAEFILNLGYVMLVVKDFCRSVAPELFLGRANERAIAMGYDSGDLIPIGVMKRQGFQALEWT